MKKSLFALAALLAVSATSAFAFETADEPATDSVNEQPGLVYDANGVEVDAHHHWRFLGCVVEHHECRFLARRYGYAFHMADRDWARCGRHRLACYAR